MWIFFEQLILGSDSACLYLSFFPCLQVPMRTLIKGAATTRAATTARWRTRSSSPCRLVDTKCDQVVTWCDQIVQCVTRW